MRVAAAALLMLTAGTVAAPAQQSETYRWCAIYSGRMGGGTSCWFTTLDQCRATVSGVGGQCIPNPSYNGMPDTRRRR